VRLKFPSRKLFPSADAFAEAIESVARDCGQNPYVLADAVLRTFEQIALRVAAGRKVLVPGFGLFSPQVDSRRKRVYPAFSGARAFRNEVRYGVSVSSPVAISGVRRHRKNHRWAQPRAGCEPTTLRKTFALSLQTLKSMNRDIA